MLNLPLGLVNAASAVVGILGFVFSICGRDGDRPQVLVKG
jgi:hypothetical protein